jgi:hypothetical protein
MKRNQVRPSNDPRIVTLPFPDDQDARLLVQWKETEPYKHHSICTYKPELSSHRNDCLWFDVSHVPRS